MTVAPRKFLTTALGSQTHAWEYGSTTGRPLVLVHGFRGDHHGLQGIAQLLAAREPQLRIIVPDVPGFGETPAIPGRVHDLALYGAWLHDFVNQLAPEGARVLGHSFGSLIVAQALSQGLQPSTTILINPIAAPALEGPQRFLTQLALGYYRTAAALPERPARTLLGHPAIVRVMSEVMAKTHDRTLRAWIHEQHHNYFSVFSDTETLTQAFRASVSHTVRDFAPAFHTPTLLIAGDRDDITPIAAQITLRDSIIDAQLIVLPGVGHLVHYEAVEDASAAILNFIRHTDPLDLTA